MGKRDDIAERYRLDSVNIADRRIAKMAQVADSLDSEMKALLIKSEVAGAVDLALAKANVESAIADAGYYVQVGEVINEDYRLVIINSFDQYKEIYKDTFLFADSSLDIMNTAKMIDLDNFNKLGEGVNTELTREVLNFGMGAVTRTQAEAHIASIIEKYIGGRSTNGWAKTAIQDGVMAHFNLANTRLALDNGLKKFKYVGGLIATSRDFCIQHVGQVHTIEEWNEIAEKWNNSGRAKVGIPFEVLRGGYNCQHSLLAVS